MPRAIKLTPDNIDKELDKKAAAHNGFGYWIIEKAVLAGLPVDSIRKLINSRPETAKKYKAIIEERHKKQLIADKALNEESRAE